MYYFANDYSEGAHRKVLEALVKANFVPTPGYGLDEYSLLAASQFKKLCDCPQGEVHFVSGGTQANRLCLSAFLKTYEAIICPDSGHINVHETGAVEASGHKIVICESHEGKVTPEGILKVLASHTDEHMVKPRLVFVTDATEIGTIYTKAELEKIAAVCKQNDLYLYLDGARLANALIAEGNDLTLKDIASLCDAFYLGGTKNGALFGEMIMITNKELQKDFRYFLKQNGAMLAKGKVLGLQFKALLEDDLYLHLAKHANALSQKIQSCLEELGVELMVKTPTNQIFPILRKDIARILHQEFVFMDWGEVDDDHVAVRLICSWATKEETVDILINKLKTLYAHQ